MTILNLEQLAFLQRARVGHLATADQAGRPHVVPVCYACDGTSIYIALDEKPKRVEAKQLRRVRNILENDEVALVVDHYDEDWSRLAYVLVRGRAVLLRPNDDEHTRALALVRERYPQYRTMRLEAQPIIAIRPSSVVAWGARGLNNSAENEQGPPA